MRRQSDFVKLQLGLGKIILKLNVERASSWTMLTSWRADHGLIPADGDDEKQSMLEELRARVKQINESIKLAQQRKDSLSFPEEEPVDSQELRDQFPDYGDEAEEDEEQGDEEDEF